MELCRILQENIIPEEDLDKIFEETTASAELDSSFLCFEDIYYKVHDAITPDYTVIDLGCAYALQAYIFKEFTRYIGVDIRTSGKTALSLLSNTEFYQMDVAKFIADVLPTLNLDMNKTVAICSYNPSYSNAEQCKIIADTFQNYYSKYCEWEDWHIQ